MKNFKEYLSESKKQYDFRVKIAGTFSTEQESVMKTLLNKYTVSAFKKTGVTPIQSVPLDFPQIKNCEVNIYEVVLDYPTTQQELTEYLSAELGVSKHNLVVRRPGEPSEVYQEPVVKREGALLNDSEYKESPNANFDDFYGDKYNTGFVKELNDILKLQRRERGEEIPTETAAKYSVDSPANTKAILNQSPDPRN
jgi:hypothetical protein